MPIEFFVKTNSSQLTGTSERVTGIDVTDLSIAHRAIVSVILDSVSRVHKKGHDGKAFFLSNIFTNLASNATGQIILDITSSAIHIIPHADVGGDFKFEIYENVTTTANGTTMTAVCTNRSLASTAQSKFYLNSTTTSDGTLLFSEFIGGGSGANFSGGGTAEYRADAEWLFKTGTKYLIRLTNLSGTTNTAGLLAHFYEET